MTATRIVYVHASKFGNGATCADEFRQRMAARDIDVEVHHVGKVKPKALPPADLYVFSSPGRFGKPIGSMRKFLKKLELPAATRYALLVTELRPEPHGTTEQTATEEGPCQQVTPIMNELLGSKGLVGVGEEKVYVRGIKGPLEDGWREKVEAFAARLEPVLTAAPDHAVAVRTNA